MNIGYSVDLWGKIGKETLFQKLTKFKYFKLDFYQDWRFLTDIISTFHLSFGFTSNKYKSHIVIRTNREARIIYTMILGRRVSITVKKVHRGIMWWLFDLELTNCSTFYLHLEFFYSVENMKFALGFCTWDHHNWGFIYVLVSSFYGDIFHCFHQVYAFLSSWWFDFHQVYDFHLLI